jgi:hypothetical protein
MLRSEKEQPGSIEDAYKKVQDTLATIGSGNDLNFKQKINELKLNH